MRPVMMAMVVVVMTTFTNPEALGLGEVVVRIQRHGAPEVDLPELKRHSHLLLPHELPRQVEHLHKREIKIK
jgi:hypothetical protein